MMNEGSTSPIIFLLSYIRYNTGLNCHDTQCHKKTTCLSYRVAPRVSKIDPVLLKIKYRYKLAVRWTATRVKVRPNTCMRGEVGLFNHYPHPKRQHLLGLLISINRFLHIFEKDGESACGRSHAKFTDHRIDRARCQQVPVQVSSWDRDSVANYIYMIYMWINYCGSTINVPEWHGKLNSFVENLFLNEGQWPWVNHRPPPLQLKR